MSNWYWHYWSIGPLPSSYQQCTTDQHITFDPILEGWGMGCHFADHFVNLGEYKLLRLLPSMLSRILDHMSLLVSSINALCTAYLQGHCPLVYISWSIKHFSSIFEQFWCAAFVEGTPCLCSVHPAKRLKGLQLRQQCNIYKRWHPHTAALQFAT